MADEHEGKVYDMTKQEWVDSKETKAAPPITEETDVTTQLVPKEEAKEEEKPKEEKITPTEAAAKVAEETKPVETNLKKDEVPAWVKEKFGIETQEELTEVLESSSKLADELEKERNKKVFTSEKEENLHKFLKNYDLDKLGDGMQTAAILTTLDIDKLDTRKALEEAYILENTDLTREEAKQLFNKEYRKKYEIKKESFDSDEDYEDEKKTIEIQLKKERAKAVRLLTEKKESLKVKEEPKKEEKKGVPSEAIAGYSKQVDKFLDKFDKIVEKDEDGSELYSIVLDESERNQVAKAMKAYVQRSDVYDNSGKINNFDPVALARTFSEILFGDKMSKQRNKQIKILAQGTKAEQIASRQPDKVSKSQGKTVGLSIDEQFRELAKVEAAKRQ